MDVTAQSWYRIFGREATGTSPEELALKSVVRFVRSQDELAVWNTDSQGHIFTAKEALRRFGAVRLQAIWDEGSAILPPSPSEPAKTLKDRREALGLAQDDLARYVGLPIDIVAKAESPDFTSRMRDLSRISMVLGLDEEVLGFQPGANGDAPIAIRLKAWQYDHRQKPRTTATFSEATWIIATQGRLQRLLTPNKNAQAGFTPSYNYGDAAYPVWEQADYLAGETRRLLGFPSSEPIPSLRELCHRLQVPLLHVELPPHIAGATLVTGSDRGIVVNINGNSSNVWVQRATVAHELGHLLWDPNERLNALRVDEFDQIERIVYEVQPKDYVEARANAFAVELLAPKAAIRERSGSLDRADYNGISQAMRENMIHFGLSATAMRYQLWNAYDQQFDLDKVPYPVYEPSDEWKAQEQFTDDFFPLRETPVLRRGEFASIVAQAEQQGWLAAEAAALYLETTVEEYKQHAREIARLFTS